MAIDRLETLVGNLKSRIGEGIEFALKYLDEQLRPDSSRYNSFIQIKSRYNNLQRELLLGTIDQNTYEQGRNVINNALLLLADDLTLADIKSDGKSADPAGGKRGEILYFIPDQMQLNQEEKCAVRVAWVLEALMRDWKSSAADVQKEIRMSDIMGVELLSLDERNPFAIRALSESVQFVDKDDFTEWVFYVKALLEGQFPLVLRVSVIELINNKEYKKDIVLEEYVTVVTQAGTPPRPVGYKTVNEPLVVSGYRAEERGMQAEYAAVPTAAVVSDPTSSSPASSSTGQPVVKVIGQHLIRQVVYGLIATTTIVVSIVAGVSYYQEAEAWKAAKQCGKPDCIRQYLKTNPDGRHRDEAEILLNNALSSTQPDTVLSPAVSPAPEMFAHTAPDTTEAFRLQVEDTMYFSLAEWEKSQANHSSKPKLKSTRSKPGGGTRATPTKPPVEPKVDPAPDRGVLPEKKPAPSVPVEVPVEDNDSKDPDLRGRVFFIKVPEIPIVQKGFTQLDVRFLKFNEFEEALVMLSSRNGSAFQPGQQVEFKTSDDQAFVFKVLYAAANPDYSNISRAYLRVEQPAMQAFANEKIIQIQVIDPKSGKASAYPTTRQGQRELNRRTQNALREIEKQLK